VTRGSARSLFFALATGAFLFRPPVAIAAEDTRYGDDYQRCAHGSTVDIEQCVGRLTKTWDERLNAAYSKLVRDNPQAEALRAAQRTWIQFRDANCHYYGSGEGTIRRLQFAECMRSMTAHRALELEELGRPN
jgi:uncharacterized protein YecT (DUF1311 family)